MRDTKFKIFLGVIAALALFVIVYFVVNKKSAAESNREEIKIILNNIVSNAQTHFKRTSSFKAWSIPPSLKIDKIGTFRERVEDNKVIIYAVGREIGENGLSNVNMESIVTWNGVTTKVRN